MLFVVYLAEKVASLMMTVGLWGWYEYHCWDKLYYPGVVKIVDILVFLDLHLYIYLCYVQTFKNTD